MNKKDRIEIPTDIAADVLFQSDRRCCVCREKKPVQIHHIDEDPSNGCSENLAVLCFDCHRDTQIRGGFDRKLDAAQIRRYRDDWTTRVANKREKEHGPLTLNSKFNSYWIKPVKYVQIKEDSEQHAFSIEAEYPQFGAGSSEIAEELNSSIARFIKTVVDEFRSQAIATSEDKKRLREEFSAANWDSLSIVHKISLLNSAFLSIEFALQTYRAGAAHPNSITRTLNFRFQPFAQIQLHDLFKPTADYLRVVSDYCIEELHRLQTERWHDPAERAKQLEIRKDSWICSGAGPVAKNFAHFVLMNEGITVFFDPYCVGSYAEGRYEVFVPFNVVLKPFLADELAKVLP